MCTVRNKESVSHRSTISPERRRAESASKKNPASMSLAVRCKDQSEHERGRRREARLTRVKQRVADLLRRIVDLAGRDRENDGQYQGRPKMVDAPRPSTIFFRGQVPNRIINPIV
ncbi:uncharacterized protein LOC143342412 isoform X3 [Colletes latitarsis]|uniref:uncharacterized protein LOC143342412 isoform X3 n=1 Tax=Colletes latitarsis TaxID=2605962 RepID=UPI004035E130